MKLLRSEEGYRLNKKVEYIRLNLYFIFKSVIFLLRCSMKRVIGLLIIFLLFAQVAFAERFYGSMGGSQSSSQKNNSSIYSGRNNSSHSGKIAIKKDRRFRENPSDEELYILNEYRTGLEAQMNNNRVPANPNSSNYGEKVRRQAELQYEYDRVQERMADVLRDKNKRNRGR